MLALLVDVPPLLLIDVQSLASSFGDEGAFSNAGGGMAGAVACADDAEMMVTPSSWMEI